MNDPKTVIFQSLLAMGIEVEEAENLMKKFANNPDVARALQEVSTACVVGWASAQEDFDGMAIPMGLDLDDLDDRESLSPEEILELSEGAETLEEGLERLEEEADGDDT